MGSFYGSLDHRGKCISDLGIPVLEDVFFSTEHVILHDVLGTHSLWISAVRLTRDIVQHEAQFHLICILEGLLRIKLLSHQVKYGLVWLGIFVVFLIE